MDKILYYIGGLEESTGLLVVDDTSNYRNKWEFKLEFRLNIMISNLDIVDYNYKKDHLLQGQDQGNSGQTQH